MMSSENHNRKRSFFKNQKAKKMGKRKSNQKKNSSTGKVQFFIFEIRIMQNKPNHQKTPAFINNSDLFDRQAFCRSFDERKCF